MFHHVNRGLGAAREIVVVLRTILFLMDACPEKKQMKQSNAFPEGSAS